MGAIIGWVTDILRTIFFFIDQIVYSLIDKVYSLFIEISNTTLFTEDIINEFAGKVYALVGIFMLFKVSFSILTYIVNPDEFTDKNKGLNKLVSNVLISLVLLLAVPFIFKEAMDIQRIILKDDVIPKLLSTSDVNISSQDPGQGSQMALITFQTFYNGPGETLGQVFSTDVNSKDSAGNYIYNYDLLISTAVGIVMVLLIISFCFDIALRSIKLGFLRMLAPIPIIGRVDPKKGNEVFNKWVKSCVSTYLDLFMRLLAIFFAIFIIKAMQMAQFEDAVTGDKVSVSGFTMVFIILGALMFAKQLPKLVEDLLGIKLSGNFTLNPLKRLEDVPIAGKPLASATRFAGRTVGTVAGLAGAGIATGVGMLGHGIDNLTGNRISGARNAVTGWADGIRQNVGNGVGGFLNSHTTLQNAVNRVSRDLSSISNDAQSTLYGAVGGIPGTAGLLSSGKKRYDAQIKAYDDFLKEQSALDSYLEGEIAKGKLTTPTTFEWTDVNGVTHTDTGNINVLKNKIEALKNSTGASAEEITNAELAYGKALSQAKQDYIDINKATDGAISSMLSNMNYIRRSNSGYEGFSGMGEITSGADWDNSKKTIKSQKSTVTSSDGYRRAQATANAVPNQK